MATTALEPLPPVTRVGYDHGWHLLGPTFLNLGIPMLIVDQAFIDPTAYGLEVFGTRDPRRPLPRTPLLVERSGRFIGIHDRRTPNADPITVGAFTNPVLLDWLTNTDQMILAVGGTRAMELSWAALWAFAIGIAITLPGSALHIKNHRPTPPAVNRPRAVT